jgi:histidyl-tRNA synthetase
MVFTPFNIYSNNQVLLNMPEKISNPRGTADILPSEIPAWRFVEERARELFQTYGYREIRTPIFEEVGLFKRSLGETSEVVNKQLLEVRSQRSESEDAAFALRPEGTAPIVRAYNQYNLGREEAISKLFYIGPMFRGERPQKGRLRQFHQIGAEAIGYSANHAFLDAELIALAVNLLKAFGVEGFKLKINSLGTAEDKAGFAKWLRNQLKDRIGQLSEKCKEQYEQNVFRLLDSKDKDCQALIQSLNIGTEHLSQKGLKYFDAVKRGLGSLGIPYEVSSRLVRGLDYYTHTVFEITHDGLGTQDALGAGGRYNGLVEQLGGGDARLKDQVGAIGFALGLERILLALAQQGRKFDQGNGLDVFIVHDGDEEKAFELLNLLRINSIPADMDYGQGMTEDGRIVARKMKHQMTQANKVKARFVLILGESEIRERSIGIKDMVSGVQRTVPMDQVIEELKKKLV